MPGGIPLSPDFINFILSSAPDGVGIDTVGMASDGQSLLVGLSNGALRVVPMPQVASGVIDASATTDAIAAAGDSIAWTAPTEAEAVAEEAGASGLEAAGVALAPLAVIAIVIIAYIEWQKQIEQLNEENQARKAQRDVEIKQLQTNRKVLGDKFAQSLNGGNNAINNGIDKMRLSLNKVLGTSPNASIFNSPNLSPTKATQSAIKAVNTPATTQGSNTSSTLPQQRMNSDRLGTYTNTTSSSFPKYDTENLGGYFMGIAAGFFAGLIQTTGGIYEIGNFAYQFARAFNPLDPYYYSVDGVKFRQKITNASIIIATIMSTPALQQMLIEKVGNSIKKELNDWLDKAERKQGAYNQGYAYGNAIFIIAGLLIGAEELNAIFEESTTAEQAIGRLSKRLEEEAATGKADTKIKQLESQLEKDAAKLGNKVPVKYLTAIEDAVVEVPKKEIKVPDIVESFKDGYYRTVKTIKKTKVFRDFGDEAKANGSFTTTNLNATKESTAILDDFNNTMQYKAEIEIPPNQELQIGKIGEQPPGSSNPIHKGGDDQILLPQNYDVNWIKKITDTQTGKTYSVQQFKQLHPELFK